MTKTELFNQEESAMRDRIIRQYGDYQNWYLRTFGRYADQVEKEAVLAALRLRQGDIILDAGGSSGRIALPVSRKGCRVAVGDLSFESLHVLKQKQTKLEAERLTPLQMDVCRLPFQSGCFTKALCLGVIGHIPTPLFRQQAIQELQRVLKKGGELVLTTQRWCSEEDSYADGTPKEGDYPTGGHFFRFRCEELEALLRLAGFNRIRMMPLMIGFSTRFFTLDFSRWGLWAIGLDRLSARFLNPRHHGRYLLAVAEK